MEDSSTDMLDSLSDEDNFEFGFNDNDFSDRVLHIEIIPEDTSPPSKKKRKLRSAKHNNDSDCSVGVQVESLHINSIILASKSPFFYKLFKNDMKKSQTRDVTLKIYSYEKSALMDLLSFIYSKNLSATTSSDLLGVLMVADKFAVTSCVRYCIKLLSEMPISLDSAILYLELHPTISVAELVLPLIKSSKQYLVAHYEDFSKFKKEVMELPLCVLEAVLGNDAFRVDSEDEVFEIVLKWAQAHYPELKERREIFTKHLIQLLCFPFMSSSKLKEVRICPDFYGDEVSELVVESLFYMNEVLSVQDIHVSKDLGSSTESSFSGCLYHGRRVQLECPQPRRVVYFDLKKEECLDLFPSKSLRSQPFVLGGRLFFLTAQCVQKEDIHSFGLFVKIPKGSKPCTLDFEFAVMKKTLNYAVMKSTSNNFESRHNFKNSIVTDAGLGLPNLLRMNWNNFSSDNNKYLINGILRIRVVLTLSSRA